MASPFCRCGNPQACICFTQTPRRNDAYSNPYPSPASQSPWTNQYYPPLQPQPFNFVPAPSFTTPAFHQDITFQNSYPASFNTAVPPPGPSSSRAPLSDATNTRNAPPQRSRKRKARGEGGGSRARRPRVDSSAGPAEPAVFGVGPASEAATAASVSASESAVHPSLVNIPGVNFGSIVEKGTSGSRPDATDVWYFVRGVHGAAAPASEPLPLDMSRERPSREKFSHVACRFCKIDNWRAWKNGGGQTGAIRDHLKGAHYKLWSELVLLERLKGWEKLGAPDQPAPGEREAFSLPGFYERLVKWIAVDDQSIDVVVLNPTIKLQWLREHWEAEDVAHAKEAIRGSMLEYRKEHRLQGQSQPAMQVPSAPGRRPVNPPTASNAAQALSSGLARLKQLEKSISEPNLDVDAPSQTPVLTQEEMAEAERKAVIDDEYIVDDELRRYEAQGLLTESDPEFLNFDLLLFWEFRQHDFPYMFRVALDVLPAQASAVPCERVFSSSKETDSERRNSLSPRMMEMLQILKYIYRQERIHFCGDLIATEAELSVIDIDREVVEALLAAGRTDELEDLIDSSWNTSPEPSQP